MQLQNDLLLRVLRGEKVDRPPVWLMRQAGRILPQYRELRASVSGFKELVETPELVAEVTVQPVDELGVDAAILFSDILVIPQALGLPYKIIPGKGPYFEQTIKSKADVDRLTLEGALESLQYVFDGAKLTKQELNNRIPLIGFAGAPWTIFCYMLEGEGSKTFSRARRMLYCEPELSARLLQMITDLTIEYLKGQIKAGANALQLFDSWAGIPEQGLYREFALPTIRRICASITEVPMIVFAKGAWFIVNELKDVSCEAIGLDWNMTPSWVREQGVNQVLQGNLDPCVLYAGSDVIQAKTIQMLNDFEQGHIANLGHGVYPDTPLDGVKKFVDCVKNYSYAS